VGSDPVTGRVVERSVTFYGAAAEAEQYRGGWPPSTRIAVAQRGAAPMLTIGELLECWLAADHPVASDGLGRLPVQRLLPGRGSPACRYAVVSLTARQLRVPSTHASLLSPTAEN
jgi:hypothetical protein